MKYTAIKMFWFFVNPLRKTYWFIFRPKTRGVKCLIENNGKFLLIKLNYAHRRWTIPGGKVEKHESFLDAAIRETKEETGIDVVSPVFIGTYKSNIDYKDDTVEVYFGNSDNVKAKADSFEINEVRWFSRDKMPEEYAPSLDIIFNFYDEFRLKQN